MRVESFRSVVLPPVLSPDSQQLPENLGDHAWLMNFNPFMHYVALVREPLMGKAPPLLSVAVACLLTAVGFLAAHLAYRRWRRTIIFYA